jgi:SAM-dependent methyltransferase
MRVVAPMRVVQLRQWLRQVWEQYGRGTAVGWVRFGSLRRLQPLGPMFGVWRGDNLDLCIDRYYITHFLACHAADIRGHVLEIGDNTYTQRFGGTRVTQSDVLHASPGHPAATIVADLTQADHIPSETFDCVILTQTLQYIYDVRAALHTVYRILKPAGVLLATCPGITQMSRHDCAQWGEYWRFTTMSARQLWAEAFPTHSVTVQGYGNVLTAIAFLHGLLSTELRQKELEYHDPDYEMLITVRAVKPPSPATLPLSSAEASP